MKLSDFIAQNIESILQKWDEFARSIQPSHHSMSADELRDHARELLEEIAAELVLSREEAERYERFRGAKERSELNTAAEIHAETRLEAGFDINQLVSEYRALRASVLDLWMSQRKEISGSDMEDVKRFNEALDQALADSIARYSMMVRHAQDIFLGVLGHDLRAPLQYLQLGASFLMRSDVEDSKLIQLGSRMFNSTSRMNDILDKLLDFTKSRIGEGLQITPAAADLGVIAEQVVDEFRLTAPEHVIKAEVSGDTTGEWDISRIAQIYQNLIGNALQHGSEKGTVSVFTIGAADEVRIVVHNDGEPIPLAAQQDVFDPLRRYSKKGAEEEKARKNLGLGLYITREIVIAHKGVISVESSEARGTTFTVRLPKKASR